MSSPPRLGYIGTVASNLVPVVGVLVLGWSTAALASVFVIELVSVLIWSAIAIPFAEKRPNNAISEDERLLSPLEDKRGSISLLPLLPPVYVRNLPTLLITISLLVPFELFTAIGMLALMEPTITEQTVTTILLGGVGVFVSRGIETYTGYFRGGNYREHSPRSIMLIPFKHFFGVGVLFVIAITFQDGLGSDAVLGLILFGKLVYDIRTLQIERDENKRGIFYRLYGSTETEIDPVPLTIPEGEPTRQLCVPRRIAVADALYRGVRYTCTSGVLLWYVGGFFTLVFSAPSSVVAVPFLAVLGFAAFRTTTRYVRHGTLEYHCYGDEGVLIVYDTVLGETQARLEQAAITDVTVTTDAVDHVFDTTTLTFDTDENDTPAVRLTVPDPEEIEIDDANENRPLTIPHVGDRAVVTDAIGASENLSQ